MWWKNSALTRLIPTVSECSVFTLKSESRNFFSCCNLMRWILCVATVQTHTIQIIHQSKQPSHSHFDGLFLFIFHMACLRIHGIIHLLPPLFCIASSTLGKDKKSEIIIIAAEGGNSCSVHFYRACGHWTVREPVMTALIEIWAFHIENPNRNIHKKQTTIYETM